MKGETTFNEYEVAASKTANMKLPPEMRVATFAMGLAGEAGEVVDILKKHLGHGHPLDKEKLKKELGDVLWYIAALALANDLHLEDIANANVAKLKERYPEGFSSERSINRRAEERPATTCSYCHGQGSYGEVSCRRCMGTGEIT